MLKNLIIFFLPCAYRPQRKNSENLYQRVQGTDNCHKGYGRTLCHYASDSGHIQEYENEWTNRKRLRAGKPPVEPLYTYQDAVNCLELFRKVSYDEVIKINDEIRVRFRDAGHILGSAIIEMWINERGEEIKIVFSGDLGNKDIPILRDPSIIESADYLVIESTYGNRLHNERVDKAEYFLNLINSTIEKGGNVIIPSFAVGRTQELIYELNKKKEVYDEKLKMLFATPVYIDSPMAISATEVFRNNLDCYDEEAREYIENGDNPLDFPGLQFTRTAEESKALNERKESSIIIAASGMCEAGRIRHHLKHNLWRKDSTIIFVGYQAEGTLGRRLLDGAKKVRLFGEEISVGYFMAMGSTGTIHMTPEMLQNAMQAIEDYKATTDNLKTQLDNTINTLLSSSFSGNAAEGFKFFYDNTIRPAIEEGLSSLLTTLNDIMDGILKAIPGENGLDDQLGEQNRQQG